MESSDSQKNAEIRKRKVMKFINNKKIIQNSYKISKI